MGYEMTDIKMSNMFALPLKTRESYVTSEIVLCDKIGVVKLVGYGDYINYAKTAINAYDANQERIKELETMLHALLNNKELDVFEMTTEIEELLNKE